MAFGASFGAISVGSGLTLAQTMVLSLVMFTGASQFAFVGVATAGGSPCSRAGKPAACGTQRFYGVPLSEILHPRGLARFWTAHFVIDETTAMAVSQATLEPGDMPSGHGFDLVLPVAARQPVRRTHRPSGQPQRCRARCCCPRRLLGPALALAATPRSALWH